MTADTLAIIIAGGETLTVEFKSDRKCLPDRELVESVVAMANTDGGVVVQGVEDDTGEVTGLHRNHVGRGTPAAMIANRTVPSLHVAVSEVLLAGRPVFAIEVPRTTGLVGSSDGYYANRRLKADGTPENVPMNPFEIQQRLSQLRLVDFSAQPMPEVPLSCASPLQRERMRAAIRRNVHSDKALLDLPDGEFDKALGLVREFGGKPMLTLSGVLFLTDEATIREHVPTYELAFQVLSGTDVLVNEFTRKPVVEAFDDFELRFKALQRPADDARTWVESLVERGLVETQGRGSARVYLLGASVYRREGRDAEYVRQAGMTRIEQEQMVLKLARQKGRIKRKDVMDLCRVQRGRAFYMLLKLVKGGELIPFGSGKAIEYGLPPGKDL